MSEEHDRIYRGHTETDVEVDVAVLQTKVEVIGINVEKIMTNHLPHLDEKIDKLGDRTNEIDKRNAYFSGGLAALVIVIGIVEALLQIFYRK